VIYDVYDLGPPGPDADPVSALNRGRRGDLIMAKRFPNSPWDTSREARLYEPGTRNELLPPLLYVDRILMNSHSMVLEGQVVVAMRQTAKSKTEAHAARWLCKLPGAPAVVNTAKLHARQAKLKADMAGDGFHPAYDDIADQQSTYGPPDDSITA
jgi:hypothetical protein